MHTRFHMMHIGIFHMFLNAWVYFSCHSSIYFITLFVTLSRPFWKVWGSRLKHPGVRSACASFKLHSLKRFAILWDTFRDLWLSVRQQVQYLERIYAIQSEMMQCIKLHRIYYDIIQYITIVHKRQTSSTVNTKQTQILYRSTSEKPV